MPPIRLSPYLLRVRPLFAVAPKLFQPVRDGPVRIGVDGAGIPGK